MSSNEFNQQDWPEKVDSEMNPDVGNGNQTDFDEAGFTTCKGKTTIRKERKKHKTAAAAAEIDMELVGDTIEYLQGNRNPVLTDWDEQTLHAGPVVKILLGDDVLCEKIPIRAFMVVSPMAFKYFRANPASRVLQLSRNAGDPKTLARLLNPLRGEVRSFELPIPDTLLDCVIVHQAANSLGLTDKNRPLEDVIVQIFKSRFCAWEEMRAITERISPESWVFREFARDLCGRRYRKKIRNVERFERFLSQYPVLAAVMDESTLSTRLSVRKSIIGAVPRTLPPSCRQ